MILCTLVYLRHFFRTELSELKYAEKQKRIAAAERQHQLSKHKTSDALARLKAFGAYVHIEAVTKDKTLMLSKKHTFCSNYSLHEPTLVRMQQIEQQLRRVLKMRFPSEVSSLEDELEPPSESEEIKLRQILLVKKKRTTYIK
jgi:hypothetical protein